MLFFILILLGILLVVGFIILLWRLEKQRVKKWDAFAAKHGFTHVNKDTDLPRELKRRGHRLFGIGSDRIARRILQGERNGTAVQVFQYEYTTGSGDDEQTHVHTVCRIRMPAKSPGLSIQRERILHKLWDAVGGEDIDFESDEFSRRFWVKCKDRKFAYDAITPDMMEFLLAAPERLWNWHGDELLMCRTGTLKLEHVLPSLELALAFHQRIPRHLIAARPA